MQAARPTDVIERIIRLKKTEVPPAGASVATAAEVNAAAPLAKLPRRTIQGMVHDKDGRPIVAASVALGNIPMGSVG